MPGSVTIGTPRYRPRPCGMPGCIATLANSMPCPVSASLTTSYAPAETPPEVTIRSTAAGGRVQHRAQRVDVIGDEMFDTWLRRRPRRWPPASIGAFDS